MQLKLFLFVGILPMTILIATYLFFEPPRQLLLIVQEITK